MSLEEALQYYDKGILPKKWDNTDDFILKSKLILNTAYKIKKNLKRPISKEKASNALESMVEEYGLDLSWVPCKHIWYPIPGYGGHRQALVPLVAYGPKIEDICSLIIPIVAINKLRMMGSFDKILKHELIHSSRVYTIDFIKGITLLEEYIAWGEEGRGQLFNCSNLAAYGKHTSITALELIGICSMMYFNSLLGAAPFFAGAGALYLHGFVKSYKGTKKLINLKKTFEDLFGEKGKHILVRLSEDEIRNFYELDKKDIKKDIESKDSLKWQLIKTRI